MPSESDIVERLRNDPVDRALCYQAAATIEALRAENERLRGALDNAASIAENATLPDGFRWGRDAMESFNFGRKRAALAVRAALQGGQSND